MAVSSKPRKRNAFPAGNAKVGDTVLLRVDSPDSRRWQVAPWRQLVSNGKVVEGVVLAVGVGKTGRALSVQFDGHSKPVAISTCSDPGMTVRIVPKRWPNGLRGRLSADFVPARRQVNSDQSTFLIVCRETLTAVYSQIQTTETAEFYVDEAGTFHEGKPQVEDCSTMYVTGPGELPESVLTEEVDVERYI